MAIYTIEPIFDKYKTYLPKDEDDTYKKFGSLRCKGATYSWPETLEVAYEDDDSLIEVSDISTIQIGSLVFNEKAYIELNETLNKYGEFLPLIHGDENLWLFNATNVIDAIDKTKSKFNEHGGIKLPFFNCRSIKNEHVFKIKEDNYTSIFCSEKIKKIIETSNLKGVEFIEEKCT